MTVPVPGSLTYPYDEDGVTTVFAYPVRFLEPQELTVIREVDGVPTVLAYNVDYTVSGAGMPNGGSITRTAVTNGGKIIITRSTAWKQIVDLKDKARNPAEAVELQMDRLTMAGQDNARRIGTVEGQAAAIDDAVRRSEDAAERSESAEGGSEAAQQAAEAAQAAAEQAAGSVQWPVSYGVEQSLAMAQRLQAQANIGPVKFDTVAGLLADTILDYTPASGRVAVAAGKIVEAQGFRYEVAAPDAVEFDIETAGGVRLILRPDVARARLVPALAKSLAVNIREFGEDVRLDGVQDNSDALEAMIAYGAKHMVVNEGVLRTTRGISWSGNSRLDLHGTTCQIEAPQFLSLAGSCDWLELVGCQGATYPGASGPVERRFFVAGVGSIGRINITDNDFGLGRVLVQTLYEGDTIGQISRNRWTSDQNAYLSFNSLSVGLSIDGGTGIPRRIARGVRVTDNLVNVWCPDSPNFDVMKITGQSFAAHIIRNDIVNQNEKCCAEIDCYTGAQNIFVQKNNLKNTAIKVQEYQNSGGFDTNKFWDVSENKMVFSEGYSGNSYGILAKGTYGGVYKNKVRKLWPDSGGGRDPNRSFRPIWLNQTDQPNQFGKTVISRTHVDGNIIDVSYDINTGAFGIIPIAVSYTASGSAPGAGYNVFSNNMMFGGSTVFAPNLPTDSIYTGNVWVGSFDKTNTQTSAIDAGTNNRVNAANFWA